ncbi:hypothetical protein LTS18_015067, partial [Coniosporium uncinatum]
MASRHRARPGQMKNDAADEERNIWDSLRDQAKRVDSLVADSNRIEEHQKELLSKINTAHAQSESTADLEDELLDITRKQIKLTDEIQSTLEGDDDNGALSITSGLQVLTALRASSEIENTSTNSRSQNVAKPSRNAKRKAESSVATLNDDRDSVAADSPAVSSPKVAGPSAASRLIKGSASRAGSVPAAREASVKAEDPGDSTDSLK